MKILYIITGLGLGGAEKVVVELADQMVALRHNVKIAYLTGEVVVRPTSPTVEIIALNLNSARDFITASREYKLLIKSFRPDVVHAHMLHANIFARLNRILYPVPKLICTAHSSNEGGKVRMTAYRLTNYLSDTNTNVSKKATEALIDKGAFSKKNAITVYNGIDLKNFEKLSKSIEIDRNIINMITVGRFDEVKDYPNLIHAFSLLKSYTKQQMKLTIVGDGKLRPYIEALIEKLNLNKDVVLLGRRLDIPQLLNQADIFVLSSKYEGFGLAVAEAMACECYVVSTDSGGVAEIMGKTGKLVPVGDCQALADALSEAMALSLEAIIENNKKARIRIEKMFSLEVSVQKWLALYEAE